MVLDPLAKVIIGMLMPVRICRGQFMMYILRDGERSKAKEDADYSQRHSGTEHGK